jgi:cytochrome P450
MTFALYRLAKHPEYVEPLREEIASLSSLDPVSGNTKKDMPLLDSFLKETARLHPLTSGKQMRPATAFSLNHLYLTVFYIGNTNKSHLHR